MPAIYGSRLDARNGPHGRPANVVPDLSNVYFALQATGADDAARPES